MAKKRNRKRRPNSGSPSLPVSGPGIPNARPDLTVPEPLVPQDLAPSSYTSFAWLALVAGLIAIVFAYWPTLVWVEDAWRNEPDYSHGYLVPFLALVLCWHRKDSFPGFRSSISWNGIWLIGLSIAMRILGRFVYADFLDAWSILPLITGMVWMLVGWRATLWSLPAIGFLFLMFPMPYQAESMLSWKLQGIATELSTCMLRVLGQPAVSEGHIIWMEDQRLMVEQACSGLRIFVGVAALAYFWAAMADRSWLDRLVLLVAAVPLAILVNALRITAVGLLWKTFDDPEWRNTIHDWSGYLMIPVAFGFFALIKIYWQSLYRPVEQMTAKDFVRQPA